MARPAIHPGEILGDELQEIGISTNQLAKALHIPTNRITQILAGMRGVTAETALHLGCLSAPARNSGSTCKSTTSCAWPKSDAARRFAAR